MSALPSNSFKWRIVTTYPYIAQLAVRRWREVSGALSGNDEMSVGKICGDLAYAIEITTYLSYAKTPMAVRTVRS